MKLSYLWRQQGKESNPFVPQAWLEMVQSKLPKPFPPLEEIKQSN
jgi:hypothetical protein